MDVAEIVLEYLRVLVWPVTVVGLGVLFRTEVRGLFHRISSAKLPGGLSLDFSEQIEEARRLSERVEATPTPEEHRDVPTLPLTQANARMIELGLQPSPSGLDMSHYRRLADHDPNLALAGLRIEIDILARNLARGFEVSLSPDEPATRLIRRLRDSHAITDDQAMLARKILDLSNAAVHGRVVSREEALGVIRVADVLAEQYLEWLSWGFNDGWRPN